MTAETLWDFAIARYGRPGVAAGCLHLQDTAGADVNMLLTAAWLAERDVLWVPAQIRELIDLCAGWREHCVLPLRAVRRYLKRAPQTQALHTQIRALELDAEIHQLHLLHDALQCMQLKTCSTVGINALVANLTSYLDCLNPGRTTEPAVHALIEALDNRH